MKNESQTKPVVLCVDLDGTLVKSDTLWELFLCLLRTRPFWLWKIIPWLLRGRAVLKAELSAAVSIDPATLPYRPAVLEYLKQEAARGRSIILATGSHESVARAVADHLQLFQDVIASTRDQNLRGSAKTECLVRRFGRGGFDYIGNDRSDLPVWEAARRVLVAEPTRDLARGIEERLKKPVEVVGGVRPKAFRNWLKALRVHQWSKNLLLFVPLMAAHRQSGFLLWQCCLGFVAFCFTASSVYVLNDLLDLESDRKHPSKQQRPFANGALPIPCGLLLIPLLLAIGLCFGLLLPLKFVAVLVFYWLLSVCYSFCLRQTPLVDVLVLAGLYIIRVVGGGVAVDVPLSFWMLSFALFFFLSLGLAKRFTELRQLRHLNEQSAHGRGYLVRDLEQIGSFGAASGYVSALVLALYLHSPEVTVLYNNPQLLWGGCILELYWISRVWLLVHRGELHDDPVVFAIRDRVSYVIGALVLALLLLATPK